MARGKYRGRGGGGRGGGRKPQEGSGSDSDSDFEERKPRKLAHVILKTQLSAIRSCILLNNKRTCT